jgi:hypothetical protein
MNRPTSEWTSKILKASGQAEKAVHDVNRILLDDALAQVDSQTKYRREYMANSEHVGPDYRH